MFTDESHFFIQGKHSQFVRISTCEQLSLAHFKEVVKHTPKKMFWVSLSYFALGSLVPIEGMMNSDKYADVIEKQVIPNTRTFLDDGRIFQQDLAPCHSLKKVKMLPKIRIKHFKMAWKLARP